jgi:ribonuclease/clavin/mitogillin
MNAENATLERYAFERVPLKTPTLPPATHTNTVIVGRRTCWIVDPAPEDAEERQKLLAIVEALPETGRAAQGIVLTHHHRDHVGAATWLRARTGLKIHAHARTPNLLTASSTVDIVLNEGERLAGSDADDDQWDILHTPGHASDHIVLWQKRTRTLIGGDMVASIGTIIVQPPDGEMGTYIGNLARLRDLQPERIVPSHGEVINDAIEHLQKYIDHRLRREAKVLASLKRSPRDLSTITAHAYVELNPVFHVLAAHSCRAHLIKLVDEGRAVLAELDTWRLPT